MKNKRSPSGRGKQSGIAAVEMAISLVFFVPVVIVAFELGRFLHADLALRSAVRAGAQAPLVVSQVDWTTTGIAPAIKAAAIANADSSRLPGFTENQVSASLLCACPQTASADAQICSGDLAGSDADEFVCPETDGTYTPPRVYVHVTGSYSFAASVLPTPVDGLLRLSHTATMRIQ